MAKGLPSVPSIPSKNSPLSLKAINFNKFLLSSALPDGSSAAAIFSKLFNISSDRVNVAAIPLLSS